MTHRSRGLSLCLLAASSLSSGLAQPPASKATSFQVIETTIADTHAALRAGKVTCRQLVETYLDRLLVYDQSTRLNTVVTLNPTALDDASRSTRTSPAPAPCAPCNASSWRSRTTTTPEVFRPPAAR